MDVKIVYGGVYNVMGKILYFKTTTTAYVQLPDATGQA